jgi:hypothetical protein
MSDETDREPPVVRRVRIAQSDRGGRPAEYRRERPPVRRPGFDVRPYLIGGLVSAAITGLLVLVWLLATPNNPFNSRPAPAPVPAVNNNDNGVNPLDVPTEVEPVGTGVPNAIPSTGPEQISPVPSGSPPPSGGMHPNISDLRKLYDRPGTHPLILGVRTKEEFGEGRMACPNSSHYPSL